MAAGALLALAGAPAATAAPACTDSWVGGDGNWFVPANWSSGAVPGPTDAVCITGPGNYTVTIPGGPPGPTAGKAVADTLQLGAPSGTQKVVVQADNACGDSTGFSVLEIADHGGLPTSATIGRNGQLELTQNASTCSGMANDAVLKVDTGALSNAGLITTDSGPVGATAVTGRDLQGSFVNAGGTITIAANTSWGGNGFDNAGAIKFPLPAVLEDTHSGTFINDAGGSIDSSTVPSGHLLVDSGNTFQQGDGEANPDWSRPGIAQTVIIHGGTLVYGGNGRSNIEVQGQTTLVGDVPSQSLLAIECSAGEPAVLHTNSFTNAGFIGLYGDQPETCTSGRTLSVDTGSGPGTGTVTNTGEIEGFGTISGNVDNVSGTITPGDTFHNCSPCTGAYTTGLIAVKGGFTQGSAGTLGIINYLSDASATPGSSQLSVTDTASIDGTLNIWNGFSYFGDAVVTARKVLTAASVSGTFAKLTGQPDPTYAVQYVPAYHSADVTLDVVRIPKLTVKLAGNGSGSVFSWQALLNCTSGTCAVGLSPGQTITLNATPSAHTTFNTWRSTFAGWSGACHGTGPCRLTMNGDRSVIATFTGIIRPRCTLRLKTRRPKPTLTAIAACKQATHLKLTGTVTEWMGPARTAHVRHFRLRRVTRKTDRRATTFVIELPRAALTALRQGHREAISLTLRATGPGGTSRVTTRRLPLRP